MSQRGASVLGALTAGIGGPRKSAGRLSRDARIALLQVRGGERHRLGQRLPLQRRTRGPVAAVAQRHLGVAARDRRGGRDAGGDLPAPRRRTSSAAKTRETSPSCRASLGVHGATGEQQLACIGLAHDVGKQVGRRPCPGSSRASRRGRPAWPIDAAYRMSQARARQRPAPMAGPLTAAMVGASSSGSTARPGRTPIIRVRRWSTPASGSLAIQAGVAAGAERGAGAGHHHHADGAVRGEVVDGRAPGCGHLVGHGVALGGVVERSTGPRRPGVRVAVGARARSGPAWAESTG